jgi:hypothetical protein
MDHKNIVFYLQMKAMILDAIYADLQGVLHTRQHIGTGNELNNEPDATLQRTPSGDRWLKQTVLEGSV